MRRTINRRSARLLALVTATAAIGAVGVTLAPPGLGTGNDDGGGSASKEKESVAVGRGGAVSSVDPGRLGGRASRCCAGRQRRRRRRGHGRRARRHRAVLRRRRRRRLLPLLRRVHRQGLAASTAGRPRPLAPTAKLFLDGRRAAALRRGAPAACRSARPARRHLGAGARRVRAPSRWEGARSRPTGSPATASRSTRRSASRPPTTRPLPRVPRDRGAVPAGRQAARGRHDLPQPRPRPHLPALAEKGVGAFYGGGSADDIVGPRATRRRNRPDPQGPHRRCCATDLAATR